LTEPVHAFLHHPPIGGVGAGASRGGHVEIKGELLAWVDGADDIVASGCEGVGIIDRAEGVAFRATFVVDPDNIIQHVTVNGLNVGRNPAETLRVLDALQTDELCPCNWTPGDEVLQPQAA
jgi:alkyl hydroperoxide reductase subunit AhpC